MCRYLSRLVNVQDATGVWARRRIGSNLARQVRQPESMRPEENRMTMTVASRTILNFFSDDEGQDLIEYALLAGLISLVAVTMILNLGTGVNGLWTGVDSSMGSIPAP